MTFDPNNLPDDAAALREMLLSTQEMLQNTQQALLGTMAQLDTTREQLAAKEHELQRVRHWLEQLLRHRYGQKRERVDENQLFLFAVELASTGQDAPPESKPASSAPRPAPEGHGRRRLPQSLERRRVVFDLAADQRRCPECQSELKHIGEEINERLEYVPASLHVIEEACQKYACAKGCAVVTAAKPPAPVEKGLAGPGLLAHVAVSKYGDHLPLNRQEAIFARQGVDLSRQTMCDWMRQCAELISPLYELMKERALRSKVVQTDDTPVPVLDPELPHTRTGRIWTYVGDAAHPYTVYDYTPNRSRDGPDEFLKDFRGYLQADAYSGYDGIYQDAARGVTEVACMAHARRKYFDAQSSDIMRSMVMLAYIHLLYDVEREAREGGMEPGQRHALRQARSLPILADIKAYLERERPQVLPKSPIGQAIGYTLSNWDALVRYCQDGDLEIDNNGAERSLRGVAVGRRNWTFFGSDNGGRTAAVLTSLIATCKRHHIDPFAYLRDVFQRIAAHPITQLADLLPDQWLAARTTAA
jgi:transposase